MSAARPSLSWLDRTLAAIAPSWQLKRLQARLVLGVWQRHYEAATPGRRTQHWRRASTDANLANWTSLARLRDAARDLVRNNPFAESALATIADHVVGAGITAKPLPANPKVLDLWRRWAESVDCDADGRHDFYGVQKLVIRAVAESGEVLVRRRWRRIEDGYPIPLQLQVLESDFLDTARTMPLPNGGAIIQGIEFDAIGTRVAYWLFSSHPGSTTTTTATMFAQARRIPATEVLHIYDAKRPGQVRAVTWLAPVLLRFKDFDEFEDATLMKQKIAACLAVITSDVDGSSTPLGTASTGDIQSGAASAPETDTLEPGAILNVPPGRSVDVVTPPTVGDYEPYCRVSLRAIATGLGLSYEDLTGDYTNLPFSAARMSRLRHWARVNGWRNRLMIPQLCDPVWAWAMEAIAVLDTLTPPAQKLLKGGVPVARWTAPPAPIMEPDKEGLAVQRLVRAGIRSQSEVIREAGYDPDELFAEIAADNKKLDDLGIVLDSDARQTTQHGMAQIALPPGEAGSD